MINKLPNSAGITRLMIQIERDAASMPARLPLKTCIISTLAFQRIPNSVSAPMLGAMAITRNTALTDQKLCHQPISTSKTRNNK